MKGWWGMFKALIFGVFFALTIVLLTFIPYKLIEKNKSQQENQSETREPVTVTKEEVQVNQILYQVHQLNYNFSGEKNWVEPFITEQLFKLKLFKMGDGHQNIDGVSQPDFIFSTELDEESVSTFLSVAKKITSTKTKKVYLFTTQKLNPKSIGLRFSGKKIVAEGTTLSMRRLLRHSTINCPLRYNQDKDSIQIVDEDNSDNTMTIIRLSNYALTIFNLYDGTNYE